MRLELDDLVRMHPALPDERAADLALHASVALARQGHSSGTELQADIGGVALVAELVWSERPSTDALDADHTVELGAEAVALALVHELRGWTIVRRLQKREFADWLLREPPSNREVALEVSGTAAGSLSARVEQKLEQVARCVVGHCGVCVVRFREPQARLVDRP